MANRKATLPIVSSPWVDKDGVPTVPFGTFMSAIAANIIGPLPAAADDAAAAKAGVAVNGLYHASGVVRIRII
jgi:hypothetical protein